MGHSLESSRPILNSVGTSFEFNYQHMRRLFYTVEYQYLGLQIADNHQTPAPSNRASTRFSTYSGAPTIASSSTGSTMDPRNQEFKTWSASFDRLEDKRLQQQRYVPSAQKDGDMSKLALGAKVERALGRRMTGQDATFRPRTKVLSEKIVETGA
ncbi:MAG: hypothetical protein M1820_010723 [Bogoriella megaspora]|nr:MAG: hypothetical protein M1820_010723 [Bogoriella megaspora]